MKTFSIIFGLLAIISVAYTLPTKEQGDGDDLKTFMEDLMKGVVVQMQEEDDQQSSAELQSAMRDLLVEVQGEDVDEDESGVIQDESDEAKARNEEEDILALLQGDEDDEEEEGKLQDDDGDAEEQGWFKRIIGGIRKFGGRVGRVCKKVNRYNRYLKCIPRMQAEMQKADDGDDDLAKDLIKRIANAQEDDADAQFFRKIFRRARGLWKRGRRYFKKIRRGVGRVYRGYKRIRGCIRRYG